MRTHVNEMPPHFAPTIWLVEFRFYREATGVELDYHLCEVHWQMKHFSLTNREQLLTAWNAEREHRKVTQWNTKASRRGRGEAGCRRIEENWRFQVRPQSHGLDVILINKDVNRLRVWPHRG